MIVFNGYKIFNPKIVFLFFFSMKNISCGV